jgi:hypothetical protein
VSVGAELHADDLRTTQIGGRIAADFLLDVAEPVGGRLAQQPAQRVVVVAQPAGGRGVRRVAGGGEPLQPGGAAGQLLLEQRAPDRA